MGNSGNIELKVNADKTSNRVFIDIADDGPGMKEEDKEKIFLPYFSTKKEAQDLALPLQIKLLQSTEVTSD